MKLGVSNLAWAPESDAEARDLLARLGVQGIEVAPTRIAPWDALTPARLAAFRKEWDAAGLAVSSLQAVFFGRPDAQLLGDAPGFAVMAEHTRLVAGAAAALGAGVAVFGAPRNRRRESMSVDDAMDLATTRLRTLGDIAATGGLVLGMEPVPAAYGADFLLHAAEMLDLVRRCDHPNIRPHLDVSCVGMAGDDIAAAIAAAGPALAHFHAAQPDLADFATPVPGHAQAAAALAAQAYDRWLVIEMKQQDGNGLAAVAQAVRVVQDVYAGLGSR